MAGNEDLTPKERAKKFSEGTFTASQTGAKAEAARHFRNQMRMNSNQDLAGDTDSFEKHVNGEYGDIGETPRKGVK